jgi:hypothetical protein
MSKLPTQEENPKGLYGRYIVEKVNGEPMDERAEYFILRLDEFGDPIHIAACRKAALTYVKEIYNHLPDLANDLVKRYNLDLIKF